LMNNCHIMFNLFQASPLKIKQTNNNDPNKNAHLSP